MVLERCVVIASVVRRKCRHGAIPFCLLVNNRSRCRIPWTVKIRVLWNCMHHQSVTRTLPEQCIRQQRRTTALQGKCLWIACSMNMSWKRAPARCGRLIQISEMSLFRCTRCSMKNVRAFIWNLLLFLSLQTLLHQRLFLMLVRRHVVQHGKWVLNCWKH